MFITTRQNNILELIKEHGQISVDELVERFDVTPQTIRTDLNEFKKGE